jgi:hypothetical protein
VIYWFETCTGPEERNATEFYESISFAAVPGVQIDYAAMVM